MNGRVQFADGNLEVERGAGRFITREVGAAATAAKSAATAG